MISRIRSVVLRLYSPKYLLATNTLTGGAMMFVGDIAVQRIEMIRFPENKSPHDWNRTGKFTEQIWQTCMYRQYQTSLSDKFMEQIRGKFVYDHIKETKFIREIYDYTRSQRSLSIRPDRGCSLGKFMTSKAEKLSLFIDQIYRYVIYIVVI